MDDPDAQLAGDVGGGVHGDDAVGSGGTCGVDGDDVGAGVGGEVQGGVEHAGHAEVVDVAAVAESQLLRFVLRSGLADAGAEGDVERLALGHRLDGVEDLDVSGAAAQVGAEVRRHGVAVEVGALLVDLRLRPHDDAGDAEATLQPAAGGEGAGVAVALGVVEPFQRRDVASGDLVERLCAADDRLAVDEHGAAAALPRRRAAVLRRRHVELLAQGGEQVRVIAAHGHRRRR